MGAPGGAGGGGMFEMNVPGHKVGLIIGKGGKTIKQLQERSRAKIIIIQDSPEVAHEKPLRITGDPGAVEAAKELVTSFLGQRGWMQGQSKEKRPRYSPGELNIRFIKAAPKAQDMDPQNITQAIKGENDCRPKVQGSNPTDGPMTRSRMK